MSVPHSKAELLSAIDHNYAALMTDLRRVPAARAREASLPGHVDGTWMSPADLVSYLVGWNELVLSWFAERARGLEPELPAPGLRWNQLGQLAQRFYADYAELDWAQLLERFASAEQAIVELVTARSDAELYGHAWYRSYTAGRMIQFNSSSPYANARRRIRRWLREVGLRDEGL